MNESQTMPAIHSRPGFLKSRIQVLFSRPDVSSLFRPDHLSMCATRWKKIIIDITSRLIVNWNSSKSCLGQGDFLRIVFDRIDVATFPINLNLVSRFTGQIYGQMKNPE